MSALAARGVNSYLQTEVQSRSPLELVVMLYDGALRFTADARDAMVRRDIRARQRHLSRALAIVSELQSTLDMDTGGEVAERLDKLYGFVRDRLDRRFGQAGPATARRSPSRAHDAPGRVAGDQSRERRSGHDSDHTVNARESPRCPHRAISSRPRGRAGHSAQAGTNRRASAGSQCRTKDFGALNRAADERDGLMAALVNIEGQLRVVRQTLSVSREEAKHLPGYAEAVKLHREAIALVSGILNTDGESLDALAAAELARRETARAVEQGETTLAAYRRVMTALPGATLVDRRG